MINIPIRCQLPAKNPTSVSTFPKLLLFAFISFGLITIGYFINHQNQNKTYQRQLLEKDQDEVSYIRGQKFDANTGEYVETNEIFDPKYRNQAMMYNDAALTKQATALYRYSNVLKIM
eukprot:226500_1